MLAHSNMMESHTGVTLLKLPLKLTQYFDQLLHLIYNNRTEINKGNVVPLLVLCNRFSIDHMLPTLNQFITVRIFKEFSDQLLYIFILVCFHFNLFF